MTRRMTKMAGRVGELCDAVDLLCIALSDPKTGLRRESS
ncbi:hypothetical protein HEB94_001204 [Actinopolymorpha pittospori]|uniref:Uncharacterized protein n=1 Tax=Actinopolymorpha pittospori TaxID=648752 RepID=A0A927MP94_9ACTN|nr:hypothetical protein [Actinopolymorpha pittospori]